MDGRLDTKRIKRIFKELIDEKSLLQQQNDLLKEN